MFAGSKSRHLDRDMTVPAPTSNPTTTTPILPQPWQSTRYSTYPSSLRRDTGRALCSRHARCRTLWRPHPKSPPYCQRPARPRRVHREVAHRGGGAPLSICRSVCHARLGAGDVGQQPGADVRYNRSRVCRPSRHKRHRAHVCSCTEIHDRRQRRRICAIGGDRRASWRRCQFLAEGKPLQQVRRKPRHQPVRADQPGYPT